MSNQEIPLCKLCGAPHKDIPDTENVACSNDTCPAAEWHMPLPTWKMFNDGTYLHEIEARMCAAVR